MEKIGLSETIDAVREELAAAAARVGEQEIQFPVGGVELEFNVGVTKAAEGRAGVKLWVIDLGASGSYTQESLQKVKVTLEPPVDRTGAPVKVGRRASEKP